MVTHNKASERANVCVDRFAMTEGGEKIGGGGHDKAAKQINQ